MIKDIMVPPNLKKGEKIGIAAPAGPFDKQAFYSGVRFLESKGFSIVIPHGIFEKKGYLAGSDYNRAKILNDLFSQNDIKAIFCARGGFGSVRILPMLDMEKIRDNPKIFMGFSDVSAILHFIYSKLGIMTFHGPMIINLGYYDGITKQAMLDMLLSDDKITMEPLNPFVIKPGMAQGHITGGNLATLCHLLGTPFEPDFTNHILFLEDCNEPAYKIDRMLMQMKLGGFFEKIKGVVLGSFTECGFLSDIFKIMKNIFYHKNIPVMGGFDIGHGKANMTIPLGAVARLDTDSGKLEISKKGVF